MVVIGNEAGYTRWCKGHGVNAKNFWPKDKMCYPVCADTEYDNDGNCYPRFYRLETLKRLVAEMENS